ncbi:hypothetical protein GIB67_041307 [Kingdonia uniflora]|uniref:Uncharacterized protein n=1 Tax=Kingdonia uniflora TaxID=39325 RepID=A0A7J7NJ95_9MAGN|nr:hypothetical protein GIB67_041307 [Kingdonia uniflora]
MEKAEILAKKEAEEIAKSLADNKRVNNLPSTKFSELLGKGTKDEALEVGEVVNKSVLAEVLAKESEAEILEVREVVTESFSAEVDVTANNIPEVIDGNVLVDEIQGTDTGTLE